MGINGIGLGSLLLIFIIVLLIFGTKRIRNIGKDLGAAAKSFREGLDEDKSDNTQQNKNNKTNQDQDN